ncbi:MAG: fluoride efflux transporter CrcB [Rhodospirillaceae bacterium]|nr:fluoride efflux transporter CrcB [Rhodospirillaceae bacterium]MDE0363796.1 fluoride efflux transporter CrcB [Rhodospirillaceae bacterium]
MNYLWIGLGSALGGMARYGCSGLAARYIGATFPLGTLIVNVSGSLVIGFLASLAVADGRLLISPDARAFLMIGLCGGFTTFSAFSIETLDLARDGDWLWAGANVVLSVVLCLLAVWLGYMGASAISR